ncbi:hypothetical protein EU537_01210 [Candidatus Thorarchaeota archaeon]|nr:MAG: hypothetical protein EU537_01210 [Candidatus Thorarchaeota archaeon]
MIEIREHTSDIVRRSDMAFLNAYRDCLIKEDMSEIIVGGKKFGPFKAGSKVHLPNWVIENLVHRKIADISQEDDYDSLRHLQNIYRVEEDHPHRIQEFHPLLYSALRRSLLNLQEDRTSIDPRIRDEIKKMQRIIPLIVETRLSKILRVAKSGAYQDKRKGMTLEERWLCEEMIALLSSWRAEITQ